MEKKYDLESAKLRFLCSQLYENTNPYWCYARQIRANSWRNHLKAISIALKNNLVDDSENAFNCLKAYANYKGKTLSEANMKAIYDECVADYHMIFPNDERATTTFIRIVDHMNLIIRTINRQIETIRSTYGIEDSKDERFGKTTALEIFQTQYSEVDPTMAEPYNCYGDLIEKKEKPESKDKIFSVENGKNACKVLNSFKCDLLNTFNKTFGDKSVFAALKLSDIIIK